MWPFGWSRPVSPRSACIRGRRRSSTEVAPTTRSRLEWWPPSRFPSWPRETCSAWLRPTASARIRGRPRSWWPRGMLGDPWLVQRLLSGEDGPPPTVDMAVAELRALLEAAVLGHGRAPCRQVDAEAGRLVPADGRGARADGDVAAAARVGCRPRRRPGRSRGRFAATVRRRDSSTGIFAGRLTVLLVVRYNPALFLRPRRRVLSAT